MFSAPNADTDVMGADETSGMTTRLVLLYVERHAGRRAAETMLERAGLADRREALLDEDAWFPYETKIDLFRAACDVLGDPSAMVTIGRSILEVEVGPGLKLGLKALGTPRAVYRNVVRANGRFCRSHEMWVESSEAGRVEIGFRDVRGRASSLECDYVSGLLSSVPELFGLPPAVVVHDRCAASGGSECRFVAQWEHRPALLRDAILVGSGSAVLAGVGAFVAAPVLLPLAGAALLGGTAVVGRRAWTSSLRRQRYLETDLADLTDATERLTGSLQDVVGELRLDEVLEKVTANARAAVGGTDFALLLDDGSGRLVVQSSSQEIDAETHALIEAWVASRPELLVRPQLVDAAGADVGSLCTAPLLVRGTALGLLVARAAQEHVFLPRDLSVLAGYAAQAAIAVNNARMFEAQQELATSDPLTGLLNRRAFHTELDAALAAGAGAAASAGHGPGVVVLDLDGFKQVNDTAGHAAGDRLLRAVAAALHATCRTGDRVCRVGGDEFAILVPRADPVALETLASRAAEAIDAADSRTAASFGTASAPADGTTRDELIARADARLYAAKAARTSPAAATPDEPLADAVADLLTDVLGSADQAADELRRRRAPDTLLRALERRRRRPGD